MADTPADKPADSTPEASADAAVERPASTSAETPAAAASGSEGDAAPAAKSTDAAAADAVPPAPPEPKPVVIPEALRGCVDKIHETIHNDLDDRELVKVLKKHVRQLKEWDQWSEHARNAYAHLIAAEIIHSKAASICIDNGIEFERTGKSEYEHLLRAVQKRTPR